MLFFWAANPGQFYLYMINHSVILERVKRNSTNKVVDRLAKPISESPITLAIQISLTNRIISFFHKICMSALRRDIMRNANLIY